MNIGEAIHRTIVLDEIVDVRVDTIVGRLADRIAIHVANIIIKMLEKVKVGRIPSSLEKRT